jgi:NMD protein affecting ribosome stability and mRNA decay
MMQMQSEIRLCISCGRELKTGAHRAIGICIWCVLEEQETKLTIKGQRYGRNEPDDADI